jgi:hypothetical protein
VKNVHSDALGPRLEARLRPESRDTYNTKRHGRHADLQVTRRGGGGGLRRRLAEPALDGEDDGRPADHLVAGEDLAGKVRVSMENVKLAG